MSRGVGVSHACSPTSSPSDRARPEAAFPASLAAWEYDAASQTYKRSQNGTADVVQGGQQIGAANRKIGHQVPVDRVAEGFVDAGAVLVDREAGRGPENRRGGKAAKLQIGLKRAARHVVDRGPG